MIPRDTTGIRTLVFWGAGATRELGLRLTEEQGQFICAITGASDPSKSLTERVGSALLESNIDPWRAAFVDLISILGDRDDAYRSIHLINDEERNAMRRNWDPSEDLDSRIIALRLTYDWPALKSVVKVCPGSKSGKLKLNDLFNLLDLHIPSGFGFQGPSGTGDASADRDQELRFFDARRLAGAKNALLMLLGALFYVDYQVCIAQKSDTLQKYKDAATLLGRRVLWMGLDLANAGKPLDRRDFYEDEVAFVSLNYDPILLWVQWVANRELNNSASVPHIGSPPSPLHLFNDFGHLIPSRRIEKGELRFPWYPMNEAAVQRLNESVTACGPKIRLTKILFPHGSLCWRECPDCGKLSAYHGDEWGLTSESLVPPPPLRAFTAATCPDGVSAEEKRERGRGKVDARGCLHCRTLNYAKDTQVVMQSSFKSRPPSFIEEIQRDLQAMTMKAVHIIFMGYSLPPDDVTYRAFFAARSQRTKSPVRCTVVNKDPNNPGWYGPDQIKAQGIEHGALKAAIEIFAAENVRFYGGGIPEVFLDGGLATEARLERLLTWCE